MAPTPQETSKSPGSTIAPKGIKRERDLDAISLANPNFNAMNIIRVTAIHPRDADRRPPAPKVRKIEPPECKRESCMIRVKQEKDLLKASSSSESSDEAATGSQSNKAAKSRSCSNHSTFSNSRSPKWKGFRKNVTFSSTPSRNIRPSPSNQTISRPGPPHFCFNCKTFGHTKFICTSQWNYWWPKEMLNKHPWLHRRLSNLRILHQERHEDYDQYAMEIERDVEIAEGALIEKPNANRKQNTRYWNSGHERQSATRPSRSRERTSSQPNGAMMYSYDKQYLLSNNMPRKQLMKNLQDQINYLQSSLNFLRTQCNF
ncbi:unnamed protein product [Orchesella dallaii]|uniref:CCHC-type domain-containing protein n=1 Tax=Orchesella dallaii TaxID=48710 RepID=A0ABP1PVN9_9HEXA